ncbi:MAG: site-specific DNA-methyltransferase [Dehalococcoidales bacterium]|nr:site-specific DNA-methyltransferase [Dehalococcoidales bacterium]
MTKRLKSQEKKSHISQTRYMKSQDPFDFHIAEDKAVYSTKTPFSVFYNDSEHSAKLLKGDCIDILNLASVNSIDMIFADPPYFLSNGGITCQAGRMVSVDKGKWDKSNGVSNDHDFALQWLAACRRVLKNDGTIWVSGTMHSTYSVGFALQKLGYKLLNEICWYKPNAAPNLSTRYFTHSHETVLWAAKSDKSKHKFDYQAMKNIAGGKQMRSLWKDIKVEDDSQDIWSISTTPSVEKKFGKHPTQKPLALLERIILASTNSGDIVLDPFTGSSTTGVAAIRHNRRFIGIETDTDYLELSVKRLNEELAKISNSPTLIKELA